MWAARSSSLRRPCARTAYASLNPLPSVIAGKRLVVIDDSIVRGNTSKKLVEMLRQAGAAEVHLRIVSPEVMWPCFYGIDTDTQDQLIAANMTNEQMCSYIGCDSLAFISLEDCTTQWRTRATTASATRASGRYEVEIPAPLQEKGFLERTGAHGRARFLWNEGERT